MRRNIDDGLTPARALAYSGATSPRAYYTGAFCRGRAPWCISNSITLTAAKREIDVLDPADYGKVTIAKAISVVNDGAARPASTCRAAP